VPRNVVCIALLTAVFATGALPRAALASCSGNTCTFGQFGKVTYLAAKQSTVGPLLTKIDTSYTSAFSSYSQAMEAFSELKSLTAKFGTKEQIAAEALARRASQEQLRKSSDAAAGSALQLHDVSRSIISAQGHLAIAKTNLQLANRELQNVRDANRVSELKAAAERAQSLDGIFDAASSAADLAQAAYKGEVSLEAGKAVLGAATKLIGAFRSANLQRQADELDAAVKKSSEAIGKDKIAVAVKELALAQTDLNALGPELQEAKNHFENSVKLRNADYNKGAAPKFGRLDDITKADETAGRLIRLLKQAYADAYTVQQTIGKLESSGDWMAPPQGESVQTLHALKSKADFIFKDCVDQRPVIEKVQKLIQEAYAAANDSLKSPL
jgi:hypothetical protein